MRKLALSVALLCALSITGMIGSAASTRAQITDLGSYTVTSSPNALLSVPTFGPGAFMTVSRKTAKPVTASFTVVNRSRNEVSIYATILSADARLGATITPAAPGTLTNYLGNVACTLSLKPNATTPTGSYTIQVRIVATSAGYSSTVTTSIPVTVTK